MPGMVVGPEGYLPSKYRGHGVQARWIRWTRTMWTRRTRTRLTRTRRTRTGWTGKTWPGIKWTQTRWTSGDLSTVFCRFSHRCCGNYLLIYSPIFLPFLWQCFRRSCRHICRFFPLIVLLLFPQIFPVIILPIFAVSLPIFCQFWYLFYCLFFTNKCTLFFRFLHGFLYWFFTILHHFPPWFLHLLLNWLQHRFSLPISPLISAPNLSTILWLLQIFHIQTSQLICFPN